MLASVHMADVKPRTTLAVLRRAPDPASVPGLRMARVALVTPLRTSFAPKLGFSRVALVSFWDDDVALDAFEAADDAAAPFADGWRMRLEPLRSHGTWPGLDPDLSHKRKVDYEGTAAVLTLGRVRVPRAISFLRASTKAEAATYDAKGMIWGTAMARPPFVATCSLWENSEAIAAYAFGADGEPHPGAIQADRTKPFHHESAFIRFRPYAVNGSLSGRNPLAHALV